MPCRARTTISIAAALLGGATSCRGGSTPVPAPQASERAPARPSVTAPPVQPAATATPQPAATAPPVEAAKAEPPAPVEPAAPSKEPFSFGGIYLAWGATPYTTVDITDADVPDGSTGTMHDLAESCGHCDGVETKLDPKHPLLPPGHAIGDAWIVVDGDGAHAGRTASFGAAGGASESHFHVVLSGFSGPAPGGLAFKARPGLSPTAELLEPPALPPGDPIVADVLAKLATALPERVDPEDREVVRAHPLTSDALQVLSVALPRGARALAQLSIEVPDPEAPDAGPPTYVAWLAIVHADGTLQSLYGPRHSLDTAIVTGVVDLDGDGVQEILWDTRYYEGEYHHLTVWRDGEPRNLGIGGDGA